MSMVLREPRPHAPSVERTPDGLVRKSYDNCPPLLRWSVGRLAISRECWALQKLAGSLHVPRLVSRPNPWTMVSEFVKGTPLESLPPEDAPHNLLMEQTRSLLFDLREAGVVHGDLGHDHWQDMGRETNLIWSSDSRLVALDFAGSLPLNPSLPGFRAVSRALHLHDRLLQTKIAYHFCPEMENWTAEQTRWPLQVWELLRFLGKL